MLVSEFINYIESTDTYICLSKKTRLRRKIGNIMKLKQLLRLVRESNNTERLDPNRPSVDVAFAKVKKSAVEHLKNPKSTRDLSKKAAARSKAEARGVLKHDSAARTAR